MKSTKKILSIDKLHAFENHPYKVQYNEEMEALAESIKTHGIVSPVIVRPLENTTDEYEIISGHRRVMASRKAGITEVPALIVSLDRDAAAIVLVDSNLHREHILPSEKAYAYKMKAEALEHKGFRTDLTSVQLAPRLNLCGILCVPMLLLSTCKRRLFQRAEYAHGAGCCPQARLPPHHGQGKQLRQGFRRSLPFYLP